MNVVDHNANSRLLASALAARKARIALARADPSAFAALVLKNEETGKPIQQAPMHAEWHRLVTGERRVLIWSHVESGKTQQLSVARSVWELGANPNLRIVIVSNTQKQAEKVSRAVAGYITESDELKAVFPDLRPNPGGPWTSTTLTVKRTTRAKDPSVQACGIHGNILGARIDLLVLDDILDYENTRTPHLRDDTRRWVYSTLFGRLTANSRVICVGNAWHKEDLLQHFSQEPSWEARSYPVADPETGASNWVEQWPVDRIERQRMDLGPLEFARQMMCEARSDDTARFKRAWIDACLRRGEGRTVVNGYTPPAGTRTYTGVDLAVGKTQAHDRSVLFTVARHPSGDIEALECQAGRWTADEIISRVVSAHHRFASDVIVENVSSQDLLLQIIRRDHPALPVRPFTTTARRKSDPRYGIEAMSVDLSEARWIIPSGKACAEIDVQIKDWIDEMLFYDPIAHTGDRLMASWFAWEAARKDARVGAGVELIGIGAQESTLEDNSAEEVWEWVGELENQW